MKRQLYSLCAAWIFLTRVPLPPLDLTEADFAEAPGYYPLIGALIGLFGAAGFAAGYFAVGPLVGTLVALAATMMVTGAFHEDGLADLFDGLGAQTPERMLEVMRDSRLGTFGAVALCVCLGLQVATLATFPLITALASLPLVHSLSRLSAVAVIATSTYARREGTAKPVAKGISRSALAIGIATSLAALGGFAVFISLQLALAAVLGLVIGHVAARTLFERQLGGYTGDCLGAVQQVSTVGAYIAIAAWL